jgi:hypothetical protein
VIDETIASETKEYTDDGKIEFNEPDILEQNVLIDKIPETDDDLLIEEVGIKSQDDLIVAEEQEVVETEEVEEEEGDEEEAMGKK